MKYFYITITLILVGCSTHKNVDAIKMCGPQTPRNISQKKGTNQVSFSKAPSYKKMNLCNIHFHRNAEHKGPSFSVFKGTGDHAGFTCNRQKHLSKKQLRPFSSGACTNVRPGDTIEVHWVYSSCSVTPGKGLESCLSPQCANPQLRVETQVFILVNDNRAADFGNYRYHKKMAKFQQTKSLPHRKGAVEFLGSTTGTSYNNNKCSPYQVTWSVTPSCELLNIQTLHKWCKKNIFKEDHAHGVRELVKDLNWLAPIL